MVKVLKHHTLILFCRLFDTVVKFCIGEEYLMGFYVGRLSALGLRYGVSRGKLHEAIDRSCVLLWENRWSK